MKLTIYMICMSAHFDHKQNRFNINVSGPSIPPNSLSPTLSFHFYIKGKSEYYVYNPSFEVFLNVRGTIHFIGLIHFKDNITNVSEYGGVIQGYLPLTYKIINEMEKLRENQDLNFQFRAQFNILTESEFASSSNKTNVQFDFRIPKSDWVEKWLPVLKYKDVSLVELPKIPGVDTINIIEHLNSAWKNKQMGQYNTTLNQCRLVVEELRKFVQDKGYINTEKESRDKTDWKEYFSSDSLGSIYDKIESQLYNFTSMGVHRGRSINLQEADFAMLLTHACANLVLKEQILEQ